MGRGVTLVGLDCGTTTSCLVVAKGRLTFGALGRVDVTHVEECFRSEMVFTPYQGRRIDAERLAAYLDEWLADAGVVPQEIFSGGALITGLAALRDNATAIREMLGTRLADAVLAATDAPRLEAWLAFMGNCHELSQTHAETPIINLDIGGGTTNLALGMNGQVLATGSLLVGARHLQFDPGSYRLAGLSPLAGRLLDRLEIQRAPGDELTRAEVTKIVNYYVELLVAAIGGNSHGFDEDIAREHVQASFDISQVSRQSAVVTLAGGVGELVYRLRANEAQPAATEFGDLGGELARAILNCPAIAEKMTLAPEGLGHATVFGLLRHSSELSGKTLYLPDPTRLPLTDVPLVGRLNKNSTDVQIAELLKMVVSTGRPSALQVELDEQNLDDLRRIGRLLSHGFASRPPPRGTTLVLLIDANLGKTLGYYATQWGTLELDLIVIDEVPPRDAQFVRVGRQRETVVPLWFYAVR